MTNVGTVIPCLTRVTAAEQLWHDKSDIRIILGLGIYTATMENEMNKGHVQVYNNDARTPSLHDPKYPGPWEVRQDSILRKSCRVYSSRYYYCGSLDIYSCS